MKTTKDSKAEKASNRETRAAQPAPVASLQQLQGLLGNQSLQHLLRARLLQPKLTVSQPDDPYEREAERVATDVMRMPEPAAPAVRAAQQEGGAEMPVGTAGTARRGGNAMWRNRSDKQVDSALSCNGVTATQDARVIRRTPDFEQTLRFQRRYRYSGSGAFAPDAFEPDLSGDIREWAVDNLRVLAVDRPFDAVRAQLLSAFRAAHEQLAPRVSLRRGQTYSYTARVHVNGPTIVVSAVTINGVRWTPRPEAESGPSPPLELAPELESWWRTLMATFSGATRDGVEEFRVTFRLAPARSPELVSWQRHVVQEGRDRVSPPLPASAELGRALRVNLWGSFRSPSQAHLRMLVVERHASSWVLRSNQEVPAASPGRSGDEEILNRRELYARIMAEWRSQLREISITIAGIAGEELLWWIIGGAIFRGLGFVLGRLPILRRLLFLRRMGPLSEGLGRLTTEEADDFVRIMRRIEQGERVAAPEMRRLQQLAERLESLLAARAVPAALGREEMAAFLRTVWRENPLLQRVAGAQRLSGPAQHRELIAILETFERETGMAVRRVPTGSIGPGNLASLNVEPGVLQIEEQVFRDTSTLMREVRHEIGAYFVNAGGRAPELAAGEGAFRASERLIDLMIQGMGRLPPVVD